MRTSSATTTRPAARSPVYFSVLLPPKVLTKGPNVPWCVGSVFFPPQLLTSDFGPVVFNPLGNPQRLLSTGQNFQQFETASTTKQTASFIRECATPFVPRELLQDHLLPDPSTIQHFGNLLQGLQCRDGSVVLFFIRGKGSNRVASTVCHQGNGREGYSIRTCLGSRSSADPEGSRWSASPSLQHSVQQLSAVWADFSGMEGTGLAFVAARTNYHVYFCTVLREEDQVQFISTAVSKFQVPTSHVAWSPHINGRAAVILESGTLCFFEVNASSDSNPSVVVDLIPKATLRCPIHQSFGDLSSQSSAITEFGINLLESAEGAPENVPELEKKWWCCEFGWLPHEMLIANAQEIFLVDLREQNCHDFTFHASSETDLNTEPSTSGIDSVVNMRTSQYSRFCSLEAGNQSIVAFGRDSNDGMYEFSVATEHHVILFDSRQPQTPVLQWEHGMRQEPPSILIMCPLSALRSVNDKDEVKDIANGKVILAASFTSGDMRAFCYGSKVPTVELPLGNTPKKRRVENVEGHDWENTIYAWDTPSMVYAPLTDVDDWRDGLTSIKGFYDYGLFAPKSRKVRQNIAGFVLLSDNPPEPTFNESKQTFTILQLTGQGELLAQTYKASHELQDPPKRKISSVNSKSDPKESIGALSRKYVELKFEVFPAFLKYIHTGSVLNPHSSGGSQKQEGVVANDTEGQLTPGQDEASGGTTSKHMSLDSPIVNPNVQKTTCKAGLDTQLEVLVRELNVPLNMYEAARKALGDGLPERLFHLNPGLPSDLDAHWHRGYKFPMISSLLGSTTRSSTSGDHRNGGEPSHETNLNDLTGKTSFQKTIPLPLLLEVHSIDRPNACPSENGGGSQATRTIGSSHFVQGEGLPETMHYSPSKYQNNGGGFVDGQKVLLKGSQNVESFLDQLVSRNEPLVISLVEPTQESQENRENPDSNDELGSQVLLYTMPKKDFCNFGKVDQKEPFIAAYKGMDGSNGAKSPEGIVLCDSDERSRIFVEPLYSKFVAGKAGFKTRDANLAKQYLKVDPDLCPIKLCFTDPDEELEPGELTALEDMQASFLRWQQSFSPFRSFQ